MDNKLIMKSKVLNIYKSRVKDKSKLGDWYKKRISICNSCPSNTKNIDNLSTKQKFIKFANTNKDYCVECGCGVEYKTSIKSEECPLGKWLAIETKQNTEDFSIELKDPNETGASLNKDKTLVLDYGEIKKGNKSEVEIVLKHKIDIEVGRVLTSCGCATPKLDKEKDKTFLSVTYDTKIVGTANRKLEVQYKKNGEFNTLVVNIKINVK